MGMRRFGILALVVGLAGCGGDAGLYNLRSDDRGPDEFAVLPVKPLETPQDLAALPAPTPGGANLTDPTPIADAVAALGGRPSALETDGRIRAEPALANHVARFGISPDIREVLAAEDQEFRSRNRGRVLERLFRVNVYNRVYGDFSLDQHQELERFRAAGVRTPAAPPEVN